MKITFLKWALFVVIAFMSTTLFSQEQKASNFDKTFVHNVYFWLHNPDDAQDNADFLKSLEKFLDASAYAKTKFIGKPAETPREVVDNSWTYSIVLTFDSKEAQDAYQEEPVHLKFIEESEELWERVQVYDAVYYK